MPLEPCGSFGSGGRGPLSKWMQALITLCVCTLLLYHIQVIIE